MIIMSFGFSSQTGETSRGLSIQIAHKIAELWNNHFALNLQEQTVAQLGNYLNGPVRKLAHVTEYAIIAGLIYGITALAVEEKWKRYLIVIFAIFILGGIDEIHQLYIPGRTAKITDVFVDCTGGIIGLCVSNMVVDFLVSVHKKLQNYSNGSL